MGGKPGELAYCTRCGEGISINLPQRVEVIIAFSKAFVKAHSTCPAGSYSEPIPKTPTEWAAGRDTGASSLTIYSLIREKPCPGDRHDVPHDPADFGRCYRLLKLFPSFRNGLCLVAQTFPDWKPFVDSWDELTQLYELELPTGKCPKLYERIKSLGG
jgi:hypothetical protein